MLEKKKQGRPFVGAESTTTIRIKKSDLTYLNQLRETLKEKRNKTISKLDIINQLLRNARENIDNL